MKKYLVAAALLLAGCSGCAVNLAELPGMPRLAEPSQPKAVLHGSVAFTEAEREDMELAAEMWSIQTSGVGQISIVWDFNQDSFLDVLEHKFSGHHLIYKTESEAPDVRIGVLAYVSPPGGIHNPWKQPLTIKFVADKLYTSEEPVDPEKDNLRHVALHEFGHVLGVPHLASVSAVMYPKIIKDASLCLKQPDLTAFCQANVCGQAVMHPCE